MLKRTVRNISERLVSDSAKAAWLSACTCVPVYTPSLMKHRPPYIAVLILGEDAHKCEQTAKSVSAQDYPYTSVHTVRDPLAPYKLPRDTEYVLFLIEGDELSLRALTAFAVEIAAPHPPTHNADEHSVFIYADEILDGALIEKRDYSEINTLTHAFEIGRPFCVKLNVYQKALSKINSKGAFTSAAASLVSVAREAARLSDKRSHLPFALIKSCAHAPVCAPPRSSERNLYFTDGMYKSSFRARRTDAQKQRVTAVIPLTDEYGDIQELRLLLESLDECAMHDRLSIHIVTSPLATLRQIRYCDILEKNGAAKHIKSDKTGRCALMNDGARIAEADALLFIMPGLEAISPELIECLLDPLALPDAVLSAPKLLRDDGLIYSAGEAVRRSRQPDINELPSYILSPFSGEEDNMRESNRKFYAFTIRQTSIVSGECVMVDREAFFDAGCFDETYQAGAVQELCLRLYRRSRACVYTPYARLVCRRERERLDTLDEKTRLRLMDTLRPMITKGDPFYQLDS